MKFSKLTLAIATVMSAGASTSAFAIDLYVDTETKQIYAEPGRGRVLMGAFERVEDKAVAAPAETTEIEAVRQDLETKTNEIKALQEHMDEVEKVKVTMDKKGLQVESADKNFKFKLGGRLQADATWNSNGNGYTRPPQVAGTPVLGLPVDANDGTEIRRGRMRFEGVFYKDWLTRLEADFADDNVRVKDAFLQYNGFDLFNITVGQQKQNFSRELQESSNDLMFTERSLMNILAAPVVDRAIGINFQSAGENWVAKAGAYGDSITPNTSTAGDEGWGISSRLIYDPILEKTKLIHLGVAGNYRQPDGDGAVAKNRALRLDYETTNMSNLNLIDSTIANVNNIGMLGLEAAGMWGPYSIGGEYTQMWVDRKTPFGVTPGNTDLSLNGWYAEAAWTLTGESRRYKEGNFQYLEPAKPFSLKNGTWGAVETALRYSGADLNDGSFKGGYIQNLTLAVNWYLNSNVRLMADYTTVVSLDNSPVSTTARPYGSDLLTDSYWLRAQVAY